MASALSQYRMLESQIATSRDSAISSAKFQFAAIRVEADRIRNLAVQIAIATLEQVSNSALEVRARTLQQVESDFAAVQREADRLLKKGQRDYEVSLELLQQQHAAMIAAR